MMKVKTITEGPGWYLIEGQYPSRTVRHYEGALNQADAQRMAKSLFPDEVLSVLYWNGQSWED